MRPLAALAVVALAGGGAAWWLTAPERLSASELDVAGDADRGRLAFAAAGCAGCHVAPGAADAEAPVLSGGQRFETAFGTFLAPNISPSPQGVGDWSDADVINAVMRGVSPEGAHYYPAFPWNAYWKADVQDVADLVAYLRTLPPSDAVSQPHEVPFPFSIRRAVGGWKLLFLQDEWVVEGNLSAEEAHGRYLVEALAHCGECHTPRNALGGLRTSEWLAGAPDPAGEGRIPGIDPGSLDWSAADIAAMLATGFTPEFDVVGGEMAVVVRHTSQLPASDLAAIAAYLKVVPAVEPESPEPGAGDSMAEE